MIKLVWVRFLLTLFVFLFYVLGVILIAMGVVSITRHDSVLVGGLIVIPIITVIVGIVIVLASSIGFAGVAMSKRELLTIFGWILFVIAIAVIVGVVCTFCFRHKLQQLKDDKKEEMEASFPKLNGTDMTKWDDLQSTMGCCGIEGPADWTNNNQEIPRSCCPDKPDVCTVGLTYRKGCHEKVFTEINIGSLVLGGMGIGIAIIVILTSALACTFAQTL